MSIARALVGFGETRGFVKDSTELRRVLNLPRASAWEDSSEVLSKFYRRPGGTMTFFPVQAKILETMHDVGGLFGLVGVGEGKTLPSYVSGTVMDAKRVAIIVPSKLRKKTHRDFAKLKPHWYGPDKYKVFGYREIGVVSGETKLQDFKPDLVVLDEFHHVGNPASSVSKRVVRYLRDYGPTLMAMSGSALDRSLMSIHHVLALTLGIEGMPLPAPRAECKQWARAVDEKVAIRARIGALSLFTRTELATDLQTVRDAIGERITSTPGVIRTKRSSCSAPIVIDFFDPRPDLLKPIIRKLVQTKTDPSGVECEPSMVYQHLRTLCSGFWYEQVPPYPEPYMRTRRDWNRFKTDILAQDIVIFKSVVMTRRDFEKLRTDEEPSSIDSALQVANAVRRGKLDDFGWLTKWKTEEAKYRGKQVARWITDEPLLRCIPKEPTIIWVEHRAAGRLLAKLSGLKYYAEEGLCGKESILDADPKGSIIASIGACHEGFNLQAWHRNVVVPPPANGRIWQQLLGRTHRTGQLADEVYFAIMLGHGAVFEHFVQAVQDARFIQSTEGEQKLLIADITRAV